MIEMYPTKYYQISSAFIGAVYFVGLFELLIYFCKQDSFILRYLNICKKILFIICTICGIIIYPLVYQFIYVLHHYG